MTENPVVTEMYHNRWFRIASDEAGFSEESGRRDIRLQPRQTLAFASRRTSPATICFSSPERAYLSFPQLRRDDAISGWFLIWNKQMCLTLWQLQPL